MKKLRMFMVSIAAMASILMIYPVGVNAEWKQDSIGWWYSEENSYATNWKQIHGIWYYFDNNGYMKQGWIIDSGKWYFLDANGEMQAGTIQVDGNTYYLELSGAMQTGNVVINGENYNFASSGEATGNKIPKADKAFSKEGIASTPNQLKGGEKTVEISLEGNPTTGYEWKYNINTDGIIKEDSNEYKQKNTDPRIVGSGGTYTWKFSALKEGITEITFKYCRSWEKEAIKTKTYICIVDKDLNINLKEK